MLGYVVCTRIKYVWYNFKSSDTQTINKQTIMQTETAGWHSLVWNYGCHKWWQSSISFQFNSRINAL